MRLPLKIYLTLVISAGVAFYIYLVLQEPIALSFRPLALAAILTIFIALAEIYPIPLSAKTKVQISTAPIFAVLLLFKPLLAVSAVIIGLVISQIALKRPWFDFLFDCAELGLATGIAGLIYHHLVFPPAFFLSSSPKVVMAPFAAAATLYSLNAGFVFLAAGLQLNQSPLKLWRQTVKEELPQEIALFVFGFFGALAIWQVPWTVALFPIPMLIIYRSFSRLVSLNRKITEQMEELKRTRAQLIRSDKMASIGTLSTGVAHQINNPLFVILGRTEELLAEEGRGFEPAKVKEYLKIIHEMAKRISHVVQSLLDFSRTTTRFAPVNINQALDNVLTLMQTKLEKSNIKVIKEYAGELPPVLGNFAQIQEVFTNLILNASEAMPYGGELKLSTGTNNSFVETKISDNGIGIPPEHLDKIFEPFFTTKDGGGIGLGLFIARDIVEKHQGFIKVKSEEGKGTTFTILLPSAKEEDI